AVASVMTGPDGVYLFDSLLVDSYTIVETQPTGMGSSTTNFLQATLSRGLTTGVDFGDTLGSLAGFVYADINNNGARDFNEPGIRGVNVLLTGTDANKVPVSVQTTTAPDGSYSFPDLLSGNYHVSVVQPADYVAGQASVGSVGGTVSGGELTDIPLGA